MNSVTEALSLIGSVFGMHATAVKPPATADAVPVAIVSLCSCPGSRRCTWMSMSPGVTTHDGRQLDDARVVGRQVAADARDPTVLDQQVERAVPAGDRIDHVHGLQQQSHTCSSLPSPPASRIQHGHAHRDAVRDLIENHRPRAVGHVGIDLDAAVHRPGVHDDRVRRRALAAAPASGRTA